MTPTEKQPSLLRHAAAFGVANFVFLAAAVVLLPVYARYLQPHEYGKLELLYRVGEVLSVCLMFVGLRQGSWTFYGQAETIEERQRVIGMVLVFLVGLNLVGLGLNALACGPWRQAYWSNSPEILQRGLLAGFLEMTYMVLIGLSQARLESTFVLGANLLYVCCRVSLCIFLVVALEQGVEGVIWAWLITGLAFVSVLGIREVWGSGLCFDHHLAGELLRFMLPFLPAGLFLFLLNNGDRFLLAHYWGEAEVGIYALGYKMSGIVGMLVVAPLYAVWMTRLFDVAKKPDAAEAIGRATTRILIGMTFFGLGVSILAEEIVMVLGGPAYSRSAQVVPLVMLGSWFLMLSNAQESSFYVRRQMIWKTLNTLVATLVVVACYFALIPSFAGLGAAWATLIGFAFLCLLTRLVAQRVFPICYEDGRLAVLLLSAVAFWAAAQFLPQRDWTTPVKALIWLAWPPLLWLMGWPHDEEKEWVAAQSRRSLTLLRFRGPRWPSKGPGRQEAV